MLSMLIFAAAAAPQPIIAKPAVTAVTPPICEEKGVQPADRKADRQARPQKLNELPNANAYQAVIRRDEHGCSKPSIVAYDIGSAPKKQR
jgi:hypothetical protein